MKVNSEDLRQTKLNILFNSMLSFFLEFHFCLRSSPNCAISEAKHGRFVPRLCFSIGKKFDPSLYLPLSFGAMGTGRASLRLYLKLGSVLASLMRQNLGSVHFTCQFRPLNLVNFSLLIKLTWEVLLSARF